MSTNLYDPHNPTRHSAPGVSHKTLKSGSRVTDTDAMNIATDDNGNSLHVKLDRFLERTARSDPRTLISIKGLSGRNWPERFAKFCNILAKFAPKGWVTEYLLLVHAAQPAELDSVPKALEEIDTAFLAAVNEGCPDAIKVQYETWMSTQTPGEITGIAALCFVITMMGAKNPTD